jgi:uncharacterized membrane protein YwzB
MNDAFLKFFEIGMFFIFLVVNLQLFNNVQFDKLFKKGVDPRQMQLLYFFIVISFTYLLTRAIMNVIEVSFSLVS